MSPSRLLLSTVLLSLLAFGSNRLLAQSAAGTAPMPPGVKNLPIGWGPGERDLSHTIGMNKATTAPPTGPVTAAAEYDENIGVFCLWSNAELMDELQTGNDIYVITTNSSWWNSWFSSNGIPTTNVNYLNASTDTFWVRDYGPWFIWDGNQNFGLVDNIYNRPRPLDDVIPGAIASAYGVPYYGMDLIHTGGNYYADGFGNAWSSRLVYQENPSKTEAQVNQIMEDYLGIERYVTRELNYDIEHFDTFGKVLAPDTILWGEFPYNTTPWCWSEGALDYLETLQSAYGWPYKIHRMPLYTVGSSWSAYINSLQTQKKILLAKHNQASDATAKAIYEQAAPGYQVININAAGTYWGDSIHCRSRNFIMGNAIRIYAQPHWESTDKTASPYAVKAEVIPDNATSLAANPTIYWTTTGGAPFSVATMSPTANPDEYQGYIPAQPFGTTVEYYIYAQDLTGKTKKCPFVAPDGMFQIAVAADTSHPELDHVCVMSATTAEWPLTVDCIAKDNNCVPAVTLTYKINGVLQPAVTMVKDTGTFRFTGQMTGTVAVGDLISYKIEAVDNATSPNTLASPYLGWNYFPISSQKPIVVVELDQTPGSGKVLVDACEDLGLNVRYSTTWPSSLSSYSAALVCLGMNPTKKALTSSQANALVSFLNAGGSAYMEGGDCWATDSYASTYRSYFGISSAATGADVTGTIVGVSGQPTAGMTFSFYGENDSSDHLTPSGSATAVLKTGTYNKSVFYATGTYETAASSFEISSLVDAADPSHTKLLAGRILDQLGFDIDLVAHQANNDPASYAVDIKGYANALYALLVSSAPGYRPLPYAVLVLDSVTMLPPMYGTLTAAGTAHHSFTVPTNPALDGVEVYFQAYMQNTVTGARYLTNRDVITYEIN
ncbi:MAG: agmatine deiminase family protein [Planctomycetes bacterium]|nr:agmatine deiminase family protein [Planctomycetota bacterium]